MASATKSFSIRLGLDGKAEAKFGLKDIADKSKANGQAITQGMREAICATNLLRQVFDQPEETARQARQQSQSLNTGGLVGDEVLFIANKGKISGWPDFHIKKTQNTNLLTFFLGSCSGCAAHPSYPSHLPDCQRAPTSSVRQDEQGDKAAYFAAGAI